MILKFPKENWSWWVKVLMVVITFQIMRENNTRNININRCIPFLIFMIENSFNLSYEAGDRAKQKEISDLVAILGYIPIKRITKKNRKS